MTTDCYYVYRRRIHTEYYMTDQKTNKKKKWFWRICFDRQRTHVYREIGNLRNLLSYVYVYIYIYYVYIIWRGYVLKYIPRMYTYKSVLIIYNIQSVTVGFNKYGLTLRYTHKIDHVLHLRFKTLTGQHFVFCFLSIRMIFLSFRYLYNIYELYYYTL